MNPCLCLDCGIHDTKVVLGARALESECSGQTSKEFVRIRKIDYFMENAYLEWAYENAYYRTATIIPLVALSLTSQVALGK